MCSWGDSMPINLRDHSFTKQLAPHYADLLSHYARECTIAPGGYLWRQGDTSDVLYLLCSGKVALEISVPNQGPLQIESVEEDEILGWSWLMPPARWNFDGRAITEVCALRFEGSCLREMCECDKLLGYQVFKAFAEATAKRLHSARLRLLDFFEPCAQ